MLSWKDSTQTVWQQPNKPWALSLWKKEGEIYWAEMRREPYFLLHFMDSVFHNQKGSWKARTQRGRHKMPWTKITYIKQIGIQSPFRGDPCRLMKCKASLCRTVESKEISVSRHWSPFANLQPHQSWAGPKLMARPQEPRRSIAKAAAPPLWWVLALCRGQHAACGGTDTNISWLCSTVPCHTGQLWGGQTCPRRSVEISFGQYLSGAH